MPWIGLQCAIVVFPWHTQLLFAHNQVDIVIWFVFALDQLSKTFERKLAAIFSSISLNMCLCVQKNRLIETVLLSTYNICFG